MRKRLLVREDDVGYTLAFDLGAMKAIDEGIVTAADVMLDSPHTVEALKWLKERPWVSIGWHRHLWESPVLPASEVPSLVDEEGRFKWRHNFNERKKEATYEDAYKELCAELDLCKEVYGRYPDTATLRADNIPLEWAMRDVCREYQINTIFWDFIGHGRRAGSTTSTSPLADKKARYDLANFKDYDPVQDILNLTWTYDGEVQRTGGHPGYLDDHILAESTCNIHRPKELQKMLDPRGHQFIIDNKVELVNARDVMYGTTEYQDHLKEIGSPLWIGNF